MFWTRIIVFCCLFVGYLSVTAQPFRCDGRLILTAVTGNTTNYNVIFGPFGAIFYSPFATFPAESFNAVGFNAMDNYIYGVKENTNSIVRLRADGSHEIVGTVPQVDSLRVFAGDCTPQGRYLCHNFDTGKIMAFEVVDNFSLVEEIDLFWDPASDNSGPFKTRMDDFTIDPNNPTVAYAHQADYPDDEFDPLATRGFLLKINLDFADANVGMVTPIGRIPADIVRQLGGLFFTTGGQLYGFGPYTTGSFIQNRLVSINPDNADAAILGLSTPFADISDGCSCPYSFSFTNDIRPRFVPCTNSEIDFILTFDNRSYLEISDAVLTDTLPPGIIIQEVSGQYTGDIEIGTGVGTQILTINNLKIPPRGTVQITIHATVLDVPVAAISNQAFLTNLPLLFGGSMVSNDPQTPGSAPDPSSYVSEPLLLDDATLKVVQPTDCLNANDSKVIISSPLLEPGKNFKILVRSQTWEEFRYQVTVSNENSFTIDSLLPGEYFIAEVTPENSLCSYAWREKEILIEAPNEQLQSSITSNSPICEGDTLQLDAVISPAGTVFWTGPERFVADDLQPLIDSVATDYSGIYKMVATYGFCEQTKELEVKIAPEIQATITGDSTYCERSDLKLAADGNGILKFNWTGPNQHSSNRETIQIYSIAPEDEGLYQVITDNGFCQDTASRNIRLLPSPTINMPGLIETDFCFPQKLRPIITGDPSVTYSWSGRRGLDCYDCPSPQLEIPFLPSYQLEVSNEFNCADTSVVQVVLDKTNLLYAPNVFSPNFDGKNDYFQLSPYCGISHLEDLKIFDRWGALIFSNDQPDPTNPTTFWDGQINGNPAATGVYIWRVTLVLVDGTSLFRSGDISIIN